MDTSEQYIKTREHRRKLSVAMLGNTNQERVRSSETRAKISESMCGNKNTQGIVYGDETRLKDSAAKTGAKNPAWQDGASFLPYTPEWKMEIKQIVLDRDDHTCQVCGKRPPTVKLHIHHIDYTKENCEDINLICLCHSCHSKTNHYRDYWGVIDGQFQRVPNNAD